MRKNKEMDVRQADNEEQKGEKASSPGKTFILTTLLCLVPVGVGVLMYRQLPDRIPSNFNFSGEITGYTGKLTMVFFIPVFMAAMNAFLHFALESDPKRKNYPAALKLCCKWLIPVISWIFIPASLLRGVGYQVPVSKISMVLIAFIFIIIGNYLPKCRQNYTMGIKTPWALDSEENWNKTHHMAGYLWTISGLCMLAGSFFTSTSLLYIGVPLIIAIVPFIYSYMLYRKGI